MHLRERLEVSPKPLKAQATTFLAPIPARSDVASTHAPLSHDAVYVVGNLVGLATPLTIVTPESGDLIAELADILVAVWSLALTGEARRERALPLSPSLLPDRSQCFPAASRGGQRGISPGHAAVLPDAALTAPPSPLRPSLPGSCVGVVGGMAAMSAIPDFFNHYATRLSAWRVARMKEQMGTKALTLERFKAIRPSLCPSSAPTLEHPKTCRRHCAAPAAGARACRAARLTPDAAEPWTRDASCVLATRQEIVCGNPDLHISETEVEEMFRRFDADRTGTLSPKEQAKVMQVSQRRRWRQRRSGIAPPAEECALAPSLLAQPPPPLRNRSCWRSMNHPAFGICSSRWTRGSRCVGG